MKKRKKGPPLNEIRNKNRNHDKVRLPERWTFVRSSAQVDSVVVPMFGLPIMRTKMSL